MFFADETGPNDDSWQVGDSVEVDLSSLLAEPSERARDSVEIAPISLAPRASVVGPPPPRPRKR
jgi:hypothetical protein